MKSLTICLIVLLCESWLASSQPYHPHPKVLAVREEESHLPDHLKSPALHNPRLRHILPLYSLLHPGEKLVYERPSDDVSRASIVAMLTHAGFKTRQPQYHQQPPYHQQSHHQDISSYGPSFIDPPRFITQDLLQHL